MWKYGSFRVAARAQCDVLRREEGGAFCPWSFPPMVGLETAPFFLFYFLPYGSLCRLSWLGSILQDDRVNDLSTGDASPTGEILVPQVELFGHHSAFASIALHFCLTPFKGLSRICRDLSALQRSG